MSINYRRNEKLKKTFNLIAGDFESIGPNYFTYFGHQLVNNSELGKGKKVLDIACGRGASLFKALEKVSESGHVTGVDFSNEMINGIKQKTNNENFSNLELLQMDAECLNFPSKTFDYTFCGLSIHFFSDPLLAVDEMYRVLNENGKIGISSWSIKKDISKKGIYEKAYLRVFPEVFTEKQKNNSNRPDFSSINGITTILSKAGFTSIEVHEETKTFFYNDKDEWWQEQSNNATRGFFERIKSTDPELFNDFKTAAYEEVEDHMVGNRVKFEANVLYAYGVKPSQC